MQHAKAAGAYRGPGDPDAGDGITAIRDLAVIGDRRTAAVLDRLGNILWYCPERLDRPSLLAALLDPEGGAWRLELPGARPQAHGAVHRHQAQHSALFLLAGSLDVNGEPRCIAFGGLRVDDAIEEALLRVVEPGAIAAAAEAEAQAATRRDQVRDALSRDLEAARYAADRAFRQYDAADPENRLVTAELEARWNQALIRVGEIESKIAAHDAATPRPSPVLATGITALATDLQAVWSAPTTDARLKKRVVRTVIQEVVADIDDKPPRSCC